MPRKRGPQASRLRQLRKRLLRQKGEELEEKAPGLFKPGVLDKRKKARKKREKK